MTGEPSRGPADGRYVAVLDRFEERDPDGSAESARGGGEVAVLLLESDEEVIAERSVPKWRLPADARRQDAVLEVSVRGGFVVSVEHDSAATERRTEAAQSRFDRLAERPDDGSGRADDGPGRADDGG